MCCSLFHSCRKSFEGLSFPLVLPLTPVYHVSCRKATVLGNPAQSWDSPNKNGRQGYKEHHLEVPGTKVEVALRPLKEPVKVLGSKGTCLYKCEQVWNSELEGWPQEGCSLWTLPRLRWFLLWRLLKRLNELYEKELKTWEVWYKIRIVGADKSWRTGESWEGDLRVEQTTALDRIAWDTEASTDSQDPILFFFAECPHLTTDSSLHGRFWNIHQPGGVPGP